VGNGKNDRQERTKSCSTAYAGHVFCKEDVKYITEDYLNHRLEVESIQCKDSKKIKEIREIQGLKLEVFIELLTNEDKNEAMKNIAIKHFGRDTNVTIDKEIRDKIYPLLTPIYTFLDVLPNEIKRGKSKLLLSISYLHCKRQYFIFTLVLDLI
jgi:hypothetical protein